MVRPFIVEKKQDIVKIKFYLLTSQDLKSKLGYVIVILSFFIIILYYLISILSWGIWYLIKYLNNEEILQRTTGLLGLWYLAIFILSIIVSFFWFCGGLRALFTFVIIEFNDQKLSIFKRVLGCKCKRISISKADLSPLKEKQCKTQVPKVRNTSLRIRYRRRNIELAGHFLPKAMDFIKDTYHLYKTSEFSHFYVKVKNLYLK
ncbi:MAG: hypothetical protein Tsb0014_44420 [Pleurocapsa sp.]